MKKLLITGFDPFGGSDSNPSEQAVQLLPDVLGDFEIRKCIVPTVFGTATATALAAADSFCPDVILCIGVAAGRDAVTPERVAINLQDARISVSDAEGNSYDLTLRELEGDGFEAYVPGLQRGERYTVTVVLGGEDGGSTGAEFIAWDD